MHQDRRRALAPANNHTISSRGDAAVRGKSRAENGDPNSFKEGAIVRIKLENILTYESVEFYTGPSLNVIIGPNGTGKSAIVCAICLGLAGKTGWLGRASSPGDFVRYGTNKGTIELELYNCDGENYVIRREITKGRDNKATSNWWVNGRAAILKSVEEMVARLNIQVGNLVQFLPQEKVADFARMTPQELLDSTEKAVGPPEMFKIHQQLIQMGQTTHDLDKRLETMRKELDTEVQKNARLEPDVKNFREREKFLEKVNILKMKRPWLEYTDLKLVFESKKGQRDLKNEDLKRVEREHAPMMARKKTLEDLKTTLEADLKQKTQEIRANANKVSESSRDLENLDEKIGFAKSDLDMKKAEEEKRKKKLDDLTSQLAALEAELRQLQGADESHLAGEITEVSERMRQLTRDINAINQQGSGLNTELNGLRREIQDAQQELRRIQDMGNQRLEQLRRRHKHTYDAVMWLRQNRNKFKATIHEPMILCLQVNMPEHAKFVEMQISASDMRTFVCEDPDDLELFMKVMKDEQRLKVNAALVPAQPLSSFRPDYPIDRIRNYGFFSYVKDLFQCPEAVMRYVCVLYNVHRVPVGDATAHRNVEKIIRDHPELRVFYTSHVQYSIKKSRYDGATSSRNTPLRDVQFFGTSIDRQREQGLLQDIQTLQRSLEDKENGYRDLQRQQQEKERELNVLRERKKELSRQKDQKKRLEQQIQTKQESIRRVEGEAIDMEAEERVMTTKISEIIAKKCENLATMHKHTQKCFELSKEKVCKSLQQAEAVRKFSALEAQLRDRTEGLNALRIEVEHLKQAVKEAKQNARLKLEEAKTVTNTGSSAELSPELKQAFEACPQTIDELDDEIHRHQARADSIFQIDETVIKQYHDREREIARIQSSLEKQEQEEQRVRGNVTEMRNQWLNPLKELIERINENFSFFFTAMGCNGEVDLSIPEDQEAYNKYGVRIKVKFRDAEALKELTPFHQSGGERSVSTVLYMMALQELARCPFRCVDEINQGMDPVNERKVFELVVQTVCKKSASQYFLLTPKLLPDLEYVDNMKVLCVNNGPHVMSHKQWNLRAFLQRGAQVNSQ
ncbi:structural maintenance of chromosomes protein 5-like [Littorina saxatilis]|uniref:structural maintenance of chromosomes protein 5-like n=1 Tax=Littorina saxatilis TaxID=31220 RepID=UPI0038B48078